MYKPRKCIICGKKYMPTNSRQKCCGEKCSKKNLQNYFHKRNGTTLKKRVCTICGKSFETYDHRKINCSESCQETYNLIYVPTDRRTKEERTKTFCVMTGIDKERYLEIKEFMLGG